jgi:geranylgeranyl reductase family protein
MSTPRKVVVVGAGPAGSACATLLKRLGVSEVAIVERNDRARDKACAGGISPRSIALLRRADLLDGIAERAACISAARVFAPDGTVNAISCGRLALVLRRSTFDGHLLEQARAAGAEVISGRHVDRLLRDGEGTVVGVGCGETEIEGDLVVLANGAHNRIGWNTNPKERMDGVVVRYEGSSAPADQVQLAFHREILPHYAWVFPEPEGTVNVGLCRAHAPGQPPIAEQLERIVDEAFPDLRGARPIGKLKGHPIVFSTKARHLVTDGAVAVGEAARLTDGFTGEGIWHALQSGIEAARAIAAGDPGRYQRRAWHTLDPALGTAGLFKRFARTRLFEKLVAWSPARPVNLVLMKALTGLT